MAPAARQIHIIKGQSGLMHFDSVPDTSTFVTDESMSIAVQQGYATYIVNPVLYTWFSLEFATQGTQIVPSDYVYIVKTAPANMQKFGLKAIIVLQTFRVCYFSIQISIRRIKKSAVNAENPADSFLLLFLFHLPFFRKG